MAILTHGSDLRLAPTLRPLVAAADGTVRGAIARLAKLDFHAVQLDATLPGIRPRELSQRGRKDLIALLSRQDMQIAGLDLFLPRQHFVEVQHLDRAVTATLAAIELAADLGRIPVSLALPVAEMKDDVKATLVEAADGRGIRLAVHAEDQLEALGAWLEAVDQYALGAGIDPAALLARGEKAVRATQRLSKRLAVARLSDVTAGALRCALGEGELEIAAYRITIDLAPGRTGPVVLDLRGIEDPFAAAGNAKTVWDKAAFTV
jgi:sugar phosphate isomerase/epimerase